VLRILLDIENYQQVNKARHTEPSTDVQSKTISTKKMFTYCSKTAPFHSM